MKIYFTADTIHKHIYGKTYEQIITFLKKKNHEVFEKVLSENLPNISNVSEHDIQEWYKEWSSYVAACDIAVIEASYPSTIHVGFEIGNILAHNKPVILLFEIGKDPIFINSLYSSRLVKSSYTPDTLEDTLTWCLDEVKHLSHRRFTFFVSPEIDDFLNGISEDGNSRAEYIRMLIEADMKKHRQ